MPLVGDPAHVRRVVSKRERSRSVSNNQYFFRKTYNRTWLVDWFVLWYMNFTVRTLIDSVLESLCCFNLLSCEYEFAAWSLLPQLSPMISNLIRWVFEATIVTTPTKIHPTPGPHTSHIVGFLRPVQSKISPNCEVHQPSHLPPYLQWHSLANWR